MLKVNLYQANNKYYSFSSLPNEQINKDVVLDSQKYESEGYKNLTDSNYDAAILSYKKAIKLNSKKFELYFNLAKAYYYKKDYENAINYFNNAKILNPSDSECLILLGQSYKFSGFYNQAESSFQAALKLEPDSDYAKRNLSEVKNLKKAVFSPELALKEKTEQAQDNLVNAISSIKQYLPPKYLNDLSDVTIAFDSTSAMGGRNNIAQYEHLKRKITVTKDYVWASSNLVGAYLIHELVHAKDNDAYTSIKEEQDAYFEAAKFWKNNKNNIKDPEMDYVLSLYNKSPQVLADRVAEIYKLRDPDIVEVSPNHYKGVKYAAASGIKNNEKTLKSYNIIA